MWSPNSLERARFICKKQREGLTPTLPMLGSLPRRQTRAPPSPRPTKPQETLAMTKAMTTSRKTTLISIQTATGA